MARILGYLPSALLAAKAGLSGRAFERQMRALGVGARSSEVGRLYNLAKGIVQANSDEAFRDIRFAPLPSEITTWPSKTATGFRQNVTVIVRERATGQIRSVPYSAYSDSGITREEAMASAIGSYSVNNEAYNNDIIGAVHTGTFEYVPSGF